jgi:hypothetical protein
MALATVMMLLMAPQAPAMLADIPLEIIAAQGDLIVVGKVTAAAVPAEFERTVPGAGRPVKAWFTEYALAVTTVIKAPGDAPVRKRVTVPVVARARPPRLPGLVMVDGPAYPSLRKDSSYVLILRKLPGDEKGWYLPAYPKNFRPAEKAAIRRVEAAADVDSWPWGKAVGGLQIALCLSRHTATLPAGGSVRRVVRKGRRVTERIPPQVYLLSAAALRNVSDRPVTVNLYPEDRFLSIRAADKGGQTVEPDLYRWLERADLAAFGPQYLRRIGPGELLFIGPNGPAPHGLGLRLPLKPGTWSVQAAYAAKRKGADPAPWVGRIESRPVQVHVKPPKRRR